MQTDKTTKLILALIAAALWLHLLAPFLGPGVAMADNPVRTEIVNEVKVSGVVEIKRGNLDVELPKLEIDTFSRPLRVEVRP